MTTTLKILGIGILSLILSYHFNPLNTVMRESMMGPVSFIAKIGPETVVLAAKFVLLSFAVALPVLFLGPICRKHVFVKAGLFFGVLSSIVSILNFAFFEKSEIVLYAWYIIAPACALIYFLFGFACGGLLGLLGSKLLPQLR
jgi:hypothetical protein